MLLWDHFHVEAYRYKGHGMFKESLWTIYLKLEFIVSAPSIDIEFGDRTPIKTIHYVFHHAINPIIFHMDADLENTMSQLI
jgi:hypothetical protein